MDTFTLLSRSTKLRKPIDKASKVPDRSRLSTDDRASQTLKKRKRQDENLHGTAGQTSTSTHERASEDECRAILRSHKIKITALWTAQHADDDKADKKARKRRLKQNGDDGPPPANKKRKTEVVPLPLTEFSQLRSWYDLPESLLLNLDAQGFKSPTEVQTASLPLLLEGPTYGHIASQSRGILPVCNLMSVAPTGSGKTLSFLIPMLASILRKRAHGHGAGPPGPLAVIIAPTKELARQIVSESRKLCAKTGIRTTLVRKGITLYGTATTKGSGDESDASSDEEDAADAEVTSNVKSQILVATPLAMVHAATAPGVNQASLPTVENLVLDEADVLLDPLFRDQTMQIWRACSHPALRVSLWSATFGSSIEELATSTLKDSYASTGDASSAPFIRLVVGLKDSAIPNVDHRLVYAASEQGKLMGMRQLLHAPGTSSNGTVLRPPFLVFTQTIPRAVALHSELLYDIPPEAGGSSRIAVLHSDLSETARDKVMTRLRKGEIWVLITTDLLARGIDFRGINGVVNYDLPTSSAAYVHRAGRTGRAGREGGVAVTLYSKDDLPFVKNIANVIAASEGQRSGDDAAALQRKWLLESLPKVTKKDKQRLKQRGVESRRSNMAKGREDGTKNTKAQISTKGGFLRRLENNRKGAIEGSQRRKAEEAEDEVTSDGAVFTGSE